MQALRQRQEQWKKESKKLEETVKASLQEQFTVRQRELDQSMKQYAKQVAQYEEMHDKLLQWSFLQEQRMESAVNGVVDRTAPAASARFHVMLETFELDLRRVLEERSVNGQLQAARDVAQLSTSLQHVQNKVETWVDSLHQKATSSVSLIQSHNEQLQRATLQSNSLEASLVRIDESLDDVHVQLRKDFQLSQASKENSQQVMTMISEAAVLLNSSIHHYNRAQDEQGTMLRWISFVVGREGWAAFNWWWSHLLDGLEMRLRELAD